MNDEMLGALKVASAECVGLKKLAAEAMGAEMLFESKSAGTGKPKLAGNNAVDKLTCFVAAA